MSGSSEKPETAAGPGRSFPWLATFVQAGVVLVCVVIIALAATAFEPRALPIAAATGLIVVSFVLRWRPVRGWMGRRSQRSAVAIVWAVILGVGLFGAEVYARIAQDYEVVGLGLRERPDRYQAVQGLRIYNAAWLEHNHQYFTTSPATFPSAEQHPLYLFKPNLRMNSRRLPLRQGEKVSWSTNSYAFRNAEFPVTKAPGTLRIVCLGASTTEGSQGDFETYPYYLGQQLRRRFPGRSIEVINAGHSGYRSNDVASLLRLRVIPLDPDFVVLYQAANDTPFPQPSPDRGEWLGAKATHGVGSLTHGLWTQLYTRSALFGVVSDVSGVTAGMHASYRFDTKARTPSLLARYDKGTREIVQVAHKAGIKIVLSSFVTIASPHLRLSYRDSPAVFRQVYRYNYPFTPAQTGRVYDMFNAVSRKVASDLGAPYVDVAAGFPRDLRHMPIDNVHLSPEGNRELARRFADGMAALIGAVPTQAAVGSSGAEPVGAHG